MKRFKKFTTMILVFFITSSIVFAQKTTTNLTGLAGEKFTVEKTTVSKEEAPNRKQHNVSTPKAMFDLLFSYPLTYPRGTGVETDGSYLYISRWNASYFYRYSLTGTFVDSFSIGTIANIRDLAYDGQYFYGSAANNLIYKMDFTNYTLVSTITGPTGLAVRHIAYDPVSDAFWCGNWDDDFRLISKTGTVLQTIPAATHTQTSAYGSAYDIYTAGGPYLWIYNQDGNGNNIVQINATTGIPTGVSFDVTSVVATTSGIAGGCFISDLIIPNTAVIGGLIQNETIWGLELKELAIYNKDFGVSALVSPTSADLLTSSNMLTVTINNYDTLDYDSIPVVCIVDGGAPVIDTIFIGINEQSSYDFTFPQSFDFSIPGHVYHLTIYTDFNGDSFHANDTLHTTITNKWDVTPISFDEPAIIGPGNINPRATVSNLGTIATTFDVTMEIQGAGYTSTKTVTSLIPASTQQINFDTWNAANGNYTVKIYTSLPADSVHTNDTITATITVQDLDKIYCYVAYVPAAGLVEGPAVTSVQVPGLITSLQDQTGQNYITSGTWAVNKWYAVSSTDNTLLTIDSLTGARTVIGSVGLQITGLAYNYFDSKLYAIEYTGSKSVLHTINTSTGAPTLVGDCNTKLLINLACSKTGALYSVAIDDDNLYRINPFNGAATLIGAVGFDAAYAQDMEFDHKTETLYMAAYNGTSGQGELRVVNVATGNTTLIGAFQAQAEITGMAIPGTPSYSAIDAGVLAITSPVSSATLTATEHVSVIVANYGTTDITSGLSVSYKYNGGTPVTENISTTIPAGATITHTFTPTIDMSVAGSVHNLKAYTTLTNDMDYSNDTTSSIVQNTFGVYCDAGGGCDEYISKVVFGTINNSTACSTNGYANYTTISTNLGLSQTLTLTVTNGTPYSADECGVWIDWNNDGDFSDANESFTVTGSPGNGPYSSSISVPVGTSLGDKRMRIRITYDKTPDPCGIDTYGEVEDYTVKVVNDASVNDIVNNTIINIFPNPVEGQLNIVSSQKVVKLSIYNAFGQKIYDTNRIEESFSINTSNYAEGLYFVHIETANGISVEKFTVKK